MEILVENINVCEEIIKEMRLQEVDEKIINLIVNSDQYRTAIDKSQSIQRTLMITVLFRLLLQLKTYLPSELRIQLTIDNDINDWLTSIKIAIIPFIKLNSTKILEQLDSKDTL